MHSGEEFLWQPSSQCRCIASQGLAAWVARGSSGEARAHQVQQQRRLYGKYNALCTASRYLMECRVVWQQLRQRSEQCEGRSCLHDRGGRYPLRDPNACGTNGNFAAAGRCKAHCTASTISNGAQSWSGNNCASGPSNAVARTACTIAEGGTPFAILVHAVQMETLQQPADARLTAQRQRYLTSRVSPAAIAPAERAMRWQELLARSRREVTPSRP